MSTSSLVRVTWPPRYEGVIVCLDHLLKLGDLNADAEHGGFTSEAVDVFWGDRCLMCGVEPSPGRKCGNERCRRSLHPLWPAVYCCNACALEDA